MKRIRAVLRSKSVLEKVVLLVITAGLTGILIPSITALIEHRANTEQKRLEAELARQHEVIAAQVKFLQTISDLF